MDNKHAHGGGNGFLFGVLIGILIALLFTTKKGRKILKSLTEEGMDKFTSLEDLLEKRLKEEDTDDMGLGDSGKREMPPVPQAHVTTHHPHTEHTHQTEAHLYSHHYPPQTTEVPTSPVHEHHHESPHQQTHAHTEEVDTRLEEFVQQMHEPEVPSYSRPVTANRRFFRGIPKRSSN